MRFATRWGRALLALAALAATAGAGAQDMAAQFAPPLDLKPVGFNEDVKDSIGFFTDVANTVFKPAGDGPFPAVVLMHTCGGLAGAPNAHMKRHAQELLEAGYVVLVVDSFRPRGFDDCRTRVLTGSAGIADAYAALALLSAKPFVDGKRVFQAGYSWGAMIASYLASPQSARMVDSPLRFAGTVANYGSCAYKKFKLVWPDTDRPHLLLLGGRDEEVPATPCFPLLDEMKAAGQPVQWHVFPQASHAWDKQGLQHLGYVYDAQVTDEATARMKAFFESVR